MRAARSAYPWNLKAGATGVRTVVCSSITRDDHRSCRDRMRTPLPGVQVSSAARPKCQVVPICLPRTARLTDSEGSRLRFMAETRRRFDPHFRQGAVRIVRETGKSIAQVAHDLRINDGTLATQSRTTGLSRARPLPGSHPRTSGLRFPACRPCLRRCGGPGSVVVRAPPAA